MKNKGFTLIEVLAVVVLLGIIGLVAYPAVRNSIDKSKLSLYEEQIELIEDGFKNYIKSDLSLIPEEDIVLTFTLGQIKQSGTIQTEIKNPKNNRCFSNESLLTLTKREESYFYEVKDMIDSKCEQVVDAPSINLNGNVIEYVTVGDSYVDKGASAKSSNGTDLTSSITTTISGEGTIDTSVPGVYTITYSVTNKEKTNSLIRNVVVEEKKYINGIMTSTDNCINEGKCLAGTKVKVQVAPKESYNFYVIDDNTTALTLIMDRNLGDNVAWITGTDYSTENTDGTSCSYTSCNDEGPVTVLNALNARTSGWTNIPETTYTVSGLGEDEATRKYEDIEYTGRARMLTYEEATNSSIGCTTSSGSCPDWMYVNLYNTGDNNTYGYWTTTPVAGRAELAWSVYRFGCVDDNTVYYAHSGLRPVITLLK